jgi:hypothetical protein
MQNAGAYLQEGALSAPILADNAKCFAAADFERKIAQRPIIMVVAAAVESGQLLQSIAGCRVDRVAFRNVEEFNSRRHYTKL